MDHVKHSSVVLSEGFKWGAVGGANATGRFAKGFLIRIGVLAGALAAVCFTAFFLHTFESSRQALVVKMKRERVSPRL